MRQRILGLLAAHLKNRSVLAAPGLLSPKGRGIDDGGLLLSALRGIGSGFSNIPDTLQSLSGKAPCASGNGVHCADVGARTSSSNFSRPSLQRNVLEQLDEAGGSPILGRSFRSQEVQHLGQSFGTSGATLARKGGLSLVGGRGDSSEAAEGTCGRICGMAVASISGRGSSIHLGVRERQLVKCQGLRHFSTGNEAEGESVKASEGEGQRDEGEPSPPEESPWAKRRRLRRRRSVKYEGVTEAREEALDEALRFSDEKFEHIYDARGMVDQWLGKCGPTFDNMIPDGALEVGNSTADDKEGEGPYVTWETRVVLTPGGAWHPANRKVKASVVVGELGLTPQQRERLLALVGPRYNAEKDTLTITSERNRYREDNRKDVYRMLTEVIKEAKTFDVSEQQAA